MDCFRSSVNDKDAAVEDLHFQSQNQLSNRLNEIDKNKLVPDKRELKEIMHSVSLLDAPVVCQRKTAENSELGNKDDLEITTDYPKRNEDEYGDSDEDSEIEIVDVIVGDSDEMSSNELPIESTILNPTEVGSSSTKNLCDAEMVNENAICEGNIEVMTKKTPNNDICLVPVIVHADNNSNDCALIRNSKVDAVSVSNTLTNFDSNCNLPEICTTENTKNVIDIMECDIASDRATCDDVVDLTNESDEYHFYDIEYDFKHTIQLTGCWKEFSSSKRNNFTRGCKWAPDGSCILTCSDDKKLRIFNLPPQLWDSSQWSYISELESALKITEGDLIYDFCWYPLMSSSDPSTCCLASTSRKNTVHLWDGYTGELRCSYRCFNHLDELVTPHSLCFNADGEKLYCGFKNVVRIFNVNRPGRYFEERPVYSHKYGQSGIISCFAFTSADKSISAAGSYRSTIGLYAEPNGELISKFEAQTHGITQLQFSPDGKYLYSGGRKDPEIVCWDIRYYNKKLFSMRRSCETNQRMYFDISKCGKYLVSGNHNGAITFWDVTQEPEIVKDDDFPILVPMHFFMAHNDCVNGISFHPFYPLLCSSSGQRQVPTLLDDDDSEYMFSDQIEQEDNSLRLWWIGKLNK